MEERLRACGQEHILDLPNGLTPEHPVYKQLNNMDIEESLKFYSLAKKASEEGGKVDAVSPLDNVVNASAMGRAEFDNFRAKGLEAIVKSSVATVIMSGGQGTRLNYDGPKGMFDMGLPSKRSIFKIHMDNIRAVRDMARKQQSSDAPACTIPVYIMTSDLNTEIIKQYFVDNKFFGYGEEDVYFFEQGLEPCISMDGKIILESERAIAMAPDGNGGLYNALRKSGAFEHMVSRGVGHLHIYGIDNVLTRAADPLFVGSCIAQGSEIGNKVVWRANASEKVGVAVEKEGRMAILEYSEIPSELADAVDDTGKLTYGAGNICNHYVRASFLRDVVFKNLIQMYHLAPKKIPYLDLASGEVVTPQSNNGVKLEMFIFDVFPLAAKWTVLEVTREDEFAPVKNASGSKTDSPDTAREMITAQAVKWLAAVGATVHRGASGAEHVEISPFKSLGGEGLQEFAGRELVAPLFIE
jgi:UDP-N-acetylglucosamine/UDP-N-acetylgalactosamine diphosphorylase